MKKRDYNVDLFRVLATIFVVILHVLGQGGILDKASPDGALYWIAWLLEIMALCAVNCFALISGYIMVNKTIKLKNILGLWFQVFFYSLLISALIFVVIPEARSFKNLVLAFLPILGKQWWYASTYFALFFLIPILNAAINNISKKTFEKFLLVILVGVCIVDCVIPKDPFVFNNGYSVIWLMLLYFFGAYIRKYDLKEKITASKSALAFAILIVLTWLSKICIHYATKMILGEAMLDDTFVSYISITIVLAAVSLFLFCLNVKINNVFQKVVLFFAPATFGVYLIHVHPLVFQFVIKDAFVGFADKMLVLMPACVLAAAVAIFLLCSVIDLARIQFFKLIRIDRLCEIIENKVRKCWSRIFKD